MMKISIRKIIHRILVTIFFAAALIYISPLIITILNSFMTQREISENFALVKTIFEPDKRFVDIRLIPNPVSLEQYRKLLIETPVFLKAFWNSVGITLPIIIGQVIISAFGAYGFTVLEFRFKKILFFMYIVVMLLPLQVTLLPNYIVADFFNIKDSYLAIILPAIFNPLGVFLLYQHMKLIPKSYLEAAQIDGANHLEIFFHVVLPNVIGGIASIATLTFVEYWNLIDQGIIFITDRGKQPLSLFLAGIEETQLGISFAGSSFYVIPILIVLFYCHDYLKNGIQTSGLKG
ncbi:carbohydrate ABC transporter permease [Alkaliphilus crotonatoxidans]